MPGAGGIAPGELASNARSIGTRLIDNEFSDQQLGTLSASSASSAPALAMSSINTAWDDSQRRGSSAFTKLRFNAHSRVSDKLAALCLALTDQQLFPGQRSAPPDGIRLRTAATLAMQAALSSANRSVKVPDGVRGQRLADLADTLIGSNRSTAQLYQELRNALADSLDSLINPSRPYDIHDPTIGEFYAAAAATLNRCVNEAS